MLIKKSTVLSSEQIINIMLNQIRKKCIVKIPKNYNVKRIKIYNIKKINYISIMLINIIENVITTFPDYFNFTFLEINLINILVNKNCYIKAKNFLNLLKIKIVRLSKDFVQLIKSSDSLYRCKITLKTYYSILIKKIRQQKNLFSYVKKIHKILSKFPKVNSKKNGLLIFNNYLIQNLTGYFKEYHYKKKSLFYFFESIEMKNCFLDKKDLNIIIFNRFFETIRKRDTMSKILIFILIVYLNYKIIFHYEIDVTNEYCFQFFSTILSVIQINLPKSINISLYFSYKIGYCYLKKNLFLFYTILLNFVKKYLLQYNFEIKFLFMNLYDRKNQLKNFSDL